MRGALLPFLVACAIGFVWLNQGASFAHSDATAAAIEAGNAPLVDHLWYPVRFLYRQSWDEEIYFAVARAIRGLPYDRRRLLQRGQTALEHAPEPDGHWHRPYADVPTEYPPAMLPFMLAPSFVTGDIESFAWVFGALMAACLLAGAALAMRAVPEASAGGRTDRSRWWTMAALLMAQGGLAIQRLDAVPALLLAWALWAMVEKRLVTAGIALGLAAAAKLVPALLVLPMLAADWETWRAPRNFARAAAAFAGTLGLALAPMIFPVKGFLEVMRYHGERGLQVESTYGTLLGAWQTLAGTAVPTTQTYGSYNFNGAFPMVLAKLATPVTLLALIAFSAWLLRLPSPRTADERRERLALALVASVVVLWLTSKVFSPQYLTWAMPLVLAIPGARGRTISRVLVATMAVTQIYLRGYYDWVTDLRPFGVISLVVRLGLLVVFAWLLFRALAERETAPEAVREATA